MSRWRLDWFELSANRESGRDPFLKIPLGRIYSGIIDRAFPELRHIPWREDTRGTWYTFFKDVTDDELAELGDFLGRLESVLCLTVSKRLAPHFSDELSESYALDFNFKESIRPSGIRQRTEIGQWTNIAKYRKTPKAVQAVAQFLAQAVLKHPTLMRSDVIAAMPARPLSEFHLPAELVHSMSGFLGRETGLRLTKYDRPKIQELSIDEKIAALEGAFQLEETVENRTVLVIDDLYQSGASVWSLARFLKASGAREVYALACVKSWRDTDNQI